MKKKLLITGIVLSTLVLAGTTVNIYANNDGYELFKTAMKNTHKVKEANVSFEASMQDNGEVINKVEMESQNNFDQELLQSTLTYETNNEQLNFDLAYQNRNFMIKNEVQENTYLLSMDSGGEEGTAHGQHNPELLSLAEKIFDTLTLPTHDDFVVKETNGQTSIHVDLNQEEIPSIIHEVSEYVIKKGLKTHADVTMTTAEYPFLSKDITLQVPVLVSDIELEHVNIVAELTENQLIKNQTANIKVSGKDHSGNKHSLEFSMSMEYSNVNNVKLEPLELDSNKSIILDKSNFEQTHNFH